MVEIELDQVAKVMSARGYLVFTTHRSYWPGEIVADLVYCFAPIEGLTGKPFQVVMETDLTDFNEQARVGGWPTSESLLGFHYYRCTTD